MDYAISMYEGGKEVYAVDCDFFSDSELGLLCPECKQEVYLRKGNFRKPYFAHFHATTSRQVKQCSLRVSSDESTIEISDIIENRGQSVKVFQEHFLSLLYFDDDQVVNNGEFNEWFNSIKGNNQTINSIIEDCVDYFIKYWRLIVKKYIVPVTEIQDNQTRIQQQICLCVMSYLYENANFNFNLKFLLYYSIYKLNKLGTINLVRQDITTADIYKICHNVTKMIMLNPWIKALQDVKGKTNNKASKFRTNNGEISFSSDHLPIPFVVHTGRKHNIPIHYVLEITNSSPLTIEINHIIYKTLKGEKQAEKISVMIIRAGIGTLTTEVNQVPLKPKHIFSGYVNREIYNFSFHHEVVRYLALPHWINNAELYVRQNHTSPSWLLIIKLWVLVNQTENLDMKETYKQQTFNAEQFWLAIYELAPLLPNCIQLQNALKVIPDKYKYKYIFGDCEYCEL